MKALVAVVNIRAARASLEMRKRLGIVLNNEFYANVSQAYTRIYQKVKKFI